MVLQLLVIQLNSGDGEQLTFSINVILSVDEYLSDKSKCLPRQQQQRKIERIIEMEQTKEWENHVIWCPILEFTCCQPLFECVEMNILPQCVAIQFASFAVCCSAHSLTHSLSLSLHCTQFVYWHPHFGWVTLSSYLFYAWFQIHFHIFVWHVDRMFGVRLKNEQCTICDWFLFGNRINCFM